LIDLHLTDVPGASYVVSSVVEAHAKEGVELRITGLDVAHVAYHAARAVLAAGVSPLCLHVPTLELGTATRALEAFLETHERAVLVLDTPSSASSALLQELESLAARPDVTAVWVDLDV
jgi:hypothetical protein